MPLPVPVPPARRARPLVATSLGEGLASGCIRQRNLGVGVSPLVPLAILPNLSLQSISDLFFLPALQCGLPGPPLVFCPTSFPVTVLAFQATPELLLSQNFPFISYFLFAQGQIVITSQRT